MENYYAVVGSWNFKPNTQKGLTVLAYDPASGACAPLHHCDPELSAGAFCYDKARRVLYVTDECSARPGGYTAGGYVRAYALDPATGALRLLNEVSALMSKPAYLWLDPSGQYLLAACHGDRFSAVKISRNAAGRPVSSAVFEDTGVVLFPLEADGSLGEACDAYVHQGLAADQGLGCAHPHSIVGSPDGEIYFACDKGLDIIFSYRLDRQRGRLLPLCSTKMPCATAPRYSVFHPQLPVLYENNETDPRLYAFAYDKATGALRTLSTVELYDASAAAPVAPGPGGRVMPSDLALHPSGAYLYALVRGLNTVVTMDVDPHTGALTRRSGCFQLTSGSPRGLCLSPDGRFLLIASQETETITTYAVRPDGSLAATGLSAHAACAACVQILAV